MKGVAPIKLSIKKPTTGQVVRLAGYGSTTGVNPKPVNVLRTGTFTIKNVKAKTLGVSGKAPKRTTSACAYDSGAPYFSESANGPRLVSIENGGPTCPHAKVETTARIDVQVAWIRRVVG